MEAEFAQHEPPKWPNPHDHSEAESDEYERFTNPQRLRSALIRARSWAWALGEQSSVRVEVIDSTALADRFDRGLRIISERSGTLPLLILEHDGDEHDDSPEVTVALSVPDVTLDTIPDCGCDACDFGSEQLVSSVDTAFKTALGGVVAMRGPDWTATWGPGGSALSGKPGHPAFDDVMSWCRRLAEGEDVALPEGIRAWVSASWLDAIP